MLLSRILLCLLLLPSAVTFLLPSTFPQRSPFHLPSSSKRASKNNLDYSSTSQSTDHPPIPNLNSPPPSPPSNLQSLTIPELKLLLKSQNLKVSGNKSTLISRLTASSIPSPKIDLFSGSIDDIRPTSFTHEPVSPVDVSSYVNTAVVDSENTDDYKNDYDDDAGVNPKSIEEEFTQNSNSRLIDNLYRTTIKINNNEYSLTATKESLQPYLSGGSKHTSLSGGDNGDDSIYKSASEVKGVILITDDPTLSPSEICTETSPSIVISLPASYVDDIEDIWTLLNNDYGTVGKVIWRTIETPTLSNVNVVVNWRCSPSTPLEVKSITLFEDGDEVVEEKTEERMVVKWEEGSGMLLASAWCNTWGRVFLRTR